MLRSSLRCGAYFVGAPTSRGADESVSVDVVSGVVWDGEQDHPVADLTLQFGYAEAGVTLYAADARVLANQLLDAVEDALPAFG